MMRDARSLDDEGGEMAVTRQTQGRSGVKIAPSARGAALRSSTISYRRDRISDGDCWRDEKSNVATL